jgi:hypothetical protein
VAILLPAATPEIERESSREFAHLRLKVVQYTYLSSDRLSGCNDSVRLVGHSESYA